MRRLSRLSGSSGSRLSWPCRDRRPLREMRVADLVEVVGEVGGDPQPRAPAGRFPEAVVHGQQAARIVGEAVDVGLRVQLDSPGLRHILGSEVEIAQGVERRGGAVAQDLDVQAIHGAGALREGQVAGQRLDRIRVVVIPAQHAQARELLQGHPVLEGDLRELLGPRLRGHYLHELDPGVRVVLLHQPGQVAEEPAADRAKGTRLGDRSELGETVHPGQGGAAHVAADADLDAAGSGCRCGRVARHRQIVLPRPGGVKHGCGRRLSSEPSAGSLPRPGTSPPRAPTPRW